MNCYYHPDREVVGMCVSCGKPICVECKVILGEKFYCNPCADKLFAAASTPAIGKDLNWFHRHLNWTAFLSWVALYPLIFLAGFVLGLILYSVDPSVSEESVTAFGYLIGFTVALAWLLPTNGWILKQKGRSLWHLLWLFVPFGIWVFLSLENKNEHFKKTRSAWIKWGVVVVVVAPILAAVIIPNVGRFLGRGETEAAKTELANIQAAVVACMVDNNLTRLPNPVTAATNDMMAFPDNTAAASKGRDVLGNTYNASDKAGFILYQHDRIADSNAIDNLVDYVATRYSRYTYKVDRNGTATQVTLATSNQ